MASVMAAFHVKRTPEPSRRALALALGVHDAVQQLGLLRGEADRLAGLAAVAPERGGLEGDVRGVGPHGPEHEAHVSPAGVARGKNIIPPRTRWAGGRASAILEDGAGIGSVPFVYYRHQVYQGRWMTWTSVA